MLSNVGKGHHYVEGLTPMCLIVNRKWIQNVFITHVIKEEQNTLHMI